MLSPVSHIPPGRYPADIFFKKPICEKENVVTVIIVIVRNWE